MGEPCRRCGRSPCHDHAIIGGPHRWGCTCWTCAERDRRGQEASDRAVKFMEDCLAVENAPPPEHDNYEVSPW